jgi:YVTN family beta-propeller protein
MRFICQAVARKRKDSDSSTFIFITLRSDNNNYLYIVDRFSDSIHVIDDDNHTLDTITVGRSPIDIAVNPLTELMYVPNILDHTISVIDSSTVSKNSTGNVVGMIKVGRLPYNIAVNPNTNMIYLTYSPYNNVSVIDGSKANSLVSNIRVSTYNNGSESNNSDTLAKFLNLPENTLAVNPNTNRIYVADMVIVFVFPQ